MSILSNDSPDGEPVSRDLPFRRPAAQIPIDPEWWAKWKKEMLEDPHLFCGLGNPCQTAKKP